MELHPVAIVFFALSMGAMFDITGAILAVPLAATTKILIDEFYLRPQRVPLETIAAEAEDIVAGRGLADEIPEETDKVERTNEVEKTDDAKA